MVVVQAGFVDVASTSIIELGLELEPMGLFDYDNKGSRSWPPFKSMYGPTQCSMDCVLLLMAVEVEEDRRLNSRV